MLHVNLPSLEKPHNYLILGSFVFVLLIMYVCGELLVSAGGTVDSEKQ